MRLVCLSDTHKMHKQVSIPDGDVLIFAGDMCGRGSSKSARRFAKWMGSHSHKYKILVAGNHDQCLEQGERFILRQEFKDLGITYLEHEPENIEGVKFFGSPYQPEFMSWAFNKTRGEELKRLWSFIPNDTEILITHGPPMGTLDLVDNIRSRQNGEHVGCEELANRIQELKSLKVHIFGHIHCGYGLIIKDGVHYINASICTEEYKPTNIPIVLDL